MTQIEVVAAYLTARYRLARADERGASAIEWAIISAVVVTLALGIFAVIQQVVTSRAEEISRG